MRSNSIPKTDMTIFHSLIMSDFSLSQVFLSSLAFLPLSRLSRHVSNLTCRETAPELVVVRQHLSLQLSFVCSYQGLDRAGGKVGNKGGEAAETGEANGVQDDRDGLQPLG